MKNQLKELSRVKIQEIDQFLDQNKTKVAKTLKKVEKGKNILPQECLAKATRINDNLIQMPSLPQIKGLKNNFNYLVCHSDDTIYVYSLSQKLEQWVDQRKELKFDANITAFTHDRGKLFIALGTQKLYVLNLKDLSVIKILEIGDECTEVIQVNGMLILALKNENYWCISPDYHQKLIPCSSPLSQLCQADDFVIAKLNNSLCRIRPVTYDPHALYIENHTITGCDVLLQYDSATKLCFGFDTAR